MPQVGRGPLAGQVGAQHMDASTMLGAVLLRLPVAVRVDVAERTAYVAITIAGFRPGNKVSVVAEGVPAVPVLCEVLGPDRRWVFVTQR